MYEYPRQWRRLIFRSSLLLLVICLVAVASDRRGRVGIQTCLRIENPGEGPGVWSGQLAFEQWIEGTVLRSTQKDLKTGQKIKFGVYVWKGSKLADESKPQLNPKLIHVGAEIGISSSCGPLRSDGSSKYDPSCIRISCGNAKPR